MAQFLPEELAQIEAYLAEKGVVFSGSYTDAVPKETIYAATNQLFRNVPNLKLSALDEYSFSQVCYHLNYNLASVAPQDYATLLEACNNIPSDFYYSKIIDQIGRCETAELYTELASNLAASDQELILGGGDETLNRTIRIQDNRKIMRVWRANYLFECDRLSAILHVVNYKDPVTAQGRFIATEGEFIQSLPGPVNPAIYDSYFFTEGS